MYVCVYIYIQREREREKERERERERQGEREKRGTNLVWGLDERRFGLHLRESVNGIWICTDNVEVGGLPAEAETPYS